MQDRFRYFNAVVTPVACFGAVRRKVYKKDLCKMDVVFLRLFLSIVGPPGDLGIHVEFFIAQHGMPCVWQCWKFANYVSNLPRERWVVRALNWFPDHTQRAGRPAYTWDSMIQFFGEVGDNVPGTHLIG